jgi:two-component system response regulator HydG
VSELPQRADRAQLEDAPGTILVLMDDEHDRQQAVGWLEEVGYAVLAPPGREEALGLIARRLDLDVVVADAAHADGPRNVLAAAQATPAGVEVILSGAADVFVITAAIARGAASFLPHPLTQGDLLLQVARAIRAARLAEQLAQRRLVHAPRDVHFEGIVGATPRMLEVMAQLRKAAPTDASIVIFGESGAGKELVAEAIHGGSPRRDGPFVALHLHATPEGLIESELFGHRKGAFTGAHSDRTGKLELANGGTLFLDEVGDIPLETQTKLLRVLETRTFEPVGGNRTITTDFRLIAATNADIPALIAQKKFREELWYRINVIRIDLPPLRERRADLPLLLEQFMREFSEKYGKRVEGIEPDALAALRRYRWPGNIRELKNVVNRMVVLAEGPLLTLRDIPRELRTPGDDPRGPDDASDARALALTGPNGPAPGSLLAGKTMDEIERDAIKETLKLTNGNRKEAADLLQIGERTLYRKIEKFGL